MEGGGDRCLADSGERKVETPYYLAEPLRCEGNLPAGWGEGGHIAGYRGM